MLVYPTKLFEMYSSAKANQANYYVLLSINGFCAINVIMYQVLIQLVCFAIWLTPSYLAEYIYIHIHTYIYVEVIVVLH